MTLARGQRKKQHQKECHEGIFEEDMIVKEFREGKNSVVSKTIQSGQAKAGLKVLLDFKQSSAYYMWELQSNWRHQLEQIQ